MKSGGRMVSRRACLRAKIDMASFMVMRDPVIYVSSLPTTTDR